MNYALVYSDFKPFQEVSLTSAMIYLEVYDRALNRVQSKLVFNSKDYTHGEVVWAASASGQVFDGYKFPSEFFCFGVMPEQ